MAGPWEAALGQQDGDIRCRAPLYLDDPGGSAERRDGGAMGHRRGQADAAQSGGECHQAGQAEGEHVAPLGPGQGMRLVDDDGPQVLEHRDALGQRQQHGQALRGGQQQVRRRLALPAALGRRSVAAARGGGDGQRHLGDGARQIARDVGGQRLERADIERVQPRARSFGELDQAGQEPRQGLAAAGGRNQQDAVARPRGGEQIELVRARRPAPGGEPVAEAFRQCSIHRGLHRRCRGLPAIAVACQSGRSTP